MYKLDVSTGVVTELAGDGTYGFQNGAAASAKFWFPHNLAAPGDGDVVFVGDIGNSKVRKIDSGMVSTFAGSSPGFRMDRARVPSSHTLMESRRTKMALCLLPNRQTTAFAKSRHQELSRHLLVLVPPHWLMA